MKKRIVSMLLAAVIACFLAPTAFAASPESNESANGLYNLGLFKGTSTDKNGNPEYDLDRAPNRYESVTMLVRLLGKEEEALNGNWQSPFTDVVDWAKPYVGYAYANGLTNGTSATTYSGDVPVTSSQYITFILRALGYDSSKDFEWDRAWKLSDKIGLTDGRYGRSDTETFVRGDLAIIGFHALQTKQKDSNQSLAEKLIEDGVFTQDEYIKACNPPEIYKMYYDTLEYTYEINGEIYQLFGNSFRAEKGTYTVTPLWNGVPFSLCDVPHKNYTIEVDFGNGSVAKNNDGSFTVSFPATGMLNFSLWIPQQGNSRLRTSFSFYAPISQSGFELDMDGQSYIPGITYGDNSYPYLVMRVYHNGAAIDDYTVTAADGAPFTVSIQKDGSLLLMKTGKGTGSYTITHNGESATFTYICG